MSVEITLLILSLLFFVSIFTDKIGYKFGVPTLLLFLAVGMLFGPDGLGEIIWQGPHIESFTTDQALGIGTVALCIILFSGGMDTKLSDILPVLNPGIALSTAGVLLTAFISGTLIWLIFGWVQAVHTVSFATALLMACTMSSTDSASVFSILRTNGITLKHKLRPLLELESGANDPMAYIMTTTMIGIVTATTTKISALTVVQDIFIQLVVGAALGFLFGKLAVNLLRKVQLSNESLYPIMILTACIFIFSATYFMRGNSYLAVYIGGLIIGNSKFTRKRQTKSFFDGLTWLSQLLMFLMLGLMVRPHELIRLEVWLPSLIICIVLIFISRPVAVFLSLIPYPKFKTRDKLFVSWVGLKGAVPIIFAIMCRASGVEHADLLFNVIFLCTLVSLIVQGTSLSYMAHKLKLSEPAKQERKLLHFDMDLPEEIESSAHEVEVTEKMLAQGNLLMNIPMPEKTLIIMVRRDEDFFVPTGSSVLEVGDKLLAISDKDAAATEQKIEEEDDFELHLELLQLVRNTGNFLKKRWNMLANGKRKNVQTDTTTTNTQTENTTPKA